MRGDHVNGNPARSAGDTGGTSAGESKPLTTSPAAPGQARLKVLIIDDQRDALYVLQRLLTRLGHDVYPALSGAEGVLVARQVRPEVIFSDIGLPGMSGFEVARVLRAEPMLASSYLIALTGFDEEEDRQSALAAGFDRYLVKPVNFLEVEQILASLN